MDIKYTECLNFIHQRYNGKPETGIVLGTGLGGLINEISIELEIPYDELPHFPVSTLEHHSGKLIFGKIANKEVVCMQGRFHAYEGYNMFQITFPIRIMKLLGIQNLMISNIAGGINATFKKGDLVIIEDHINLQSENPLTGINENEFGPRYPDMSEPYDYKLIQQALSKAKEWNYGIHKGVYVAVNGPNLETKAEYRYLRIIGADMVGMSTVPEVIVAKHMDLKVFAISLITDECDPDNLVPINISEIIAIAEQSEPKLSKVMTYVISEIQNHSLKVEVPL